MRLVYELLQPNLIDMQSTFEKEFSGMARQTVTLNELIETRYKLITKINDILTENERLFLLSIKQGEPQ